MAKPRPCTETITRHMFVTYTCMAVQRNMTQSKGAAYHHVSGQNNVEQYSTTRPKALTIIELHLSEGIIQSVSRKFC